MQERHESIQESHPTTKLCTVSTWVLQSSCETLWRIFQCLE